MSFKTGVIKMAVKWTPSTLVSWVANFVLKDIAELKDFSCDLDARTTYVQIQLVGESETIEVWLEDFFVIGDGENYTFTVQQTKSNRIWLNNLLTRIAGKSWKIPVMPQYAAYFELVAELLQAKTSEQEDNAPVEPLPQDQH